MGKRLEDTEQEIINELYGIGYDDLKKTSEHLLDKGKYAESARMRRIIKLLRWLGGEK